jgi:hypothetical protein
MATTEPERSLNRQDQAIVEGLSEELDMPADQIVDLFERSLTRLERQARIKSFLSVIAAHQVRIAVRESRAATDTERRAHQTALDA